jgi:hypothetical protein
MYENQTAGRPLESERPDHGCREQRPQSSRPSLDEIAKSQHLLLDRLHDLRDRLSILAEFAAGPVPENPQNGRVPGQETPGGMLVEIGATLQRSGAVATEIANALTRLEQALRGT